MNLRVAVSLPLAYWMTHRGVVAFLGRRVVDGLEGHGKQLKTASRDTAVNQGLLDAML